MSKGDYDIIEVIRKKERGNKRKTKPIDFRKADFNKLGKLAASQLEIYSKGKRELAGSYRNGTKVTSAHYSNVEEKQKVDG